MKGDTWGAVGKPFQSNRDSATIVAFNKMFNLLKSKPNGSSNVILDSIPVVTIGLMYEFLLFNAAYDESLTDFKTSIQPKRSNPTLDAVCTALEARYSSQKSANISAGYREYGYK